MREIQVKRIYRHFKGDYYLVEDVAKHSETGEAYVIYRKLYGDCGLWIRPLAMFLEPVDPRKIPERCADMALRASGNRFCRRSLKGAAKSLYRCERRWAGMEDSKKTTCILRHPDPSARETLVGIFASAGLTVSAVCADWAGALDAAARVLPEMIFVHALAAGLDAGTATAQVDRLRLSRRPAIVYLVPSYLPERMTQGMRPRVDAHRTRKRFAPASPRPCPLPVRPGGRSPRGTSAGANGHCARRKPPPARVRRRAGIKRRRQRGPPEAHGLSCRRRAFPHHAPPRGGRPAPRHRRGMDDRQQRAPICPVWQHHRRAPRQAHHRRPSRHRGGAASAGS